MGKHKPVSVEDWRTEPLQPTGPATLPSGIPAAYASLIDGARSEEARAALCAQIKPSEREKTVLPCENADPLGEKRYCVTPHLVHQYPNRVLLLATGRCLGYCRYCFRRNFTARNEGFLDIAELTTVCEYLGANSAIREILVSGGDPMSGTFEELRTILDAIRLARPDILIRLCTRAPIFAPELFTPSLVAYFRSLRPFWLIPHINHGAELGDNQVRAISACIDSGIPIQSQTVLLRGVNDSSLVLSELFHTLVCLGVKPGYLFQCDLAPGTSHFRVSLDRGLAIWSELRTLLSGLSLPVYAVDLPCGGGKIPLSVLALSGTVTRNQDKKGFSAVGIDGKVYTYTDV